MSPNFPMRSRQRGSVLIVGIFVITVMFLLAAALIRMVSDADEALTLEVWGARALASANSGADAAMAKLFPISGGAPVCNSSDSWTPPAVVGFHGCVVNLSCNSFSAEGVTQYLVVSRAHCESGDLRVSRSVEVSARAIP